MGKKNQTTGGLILVDTDMFVDFFRGVEDPVTFIEKNQETIAFSAISETELSGKICNDEKEREKVFHLLSRFRKIPAGNPLVQLAGDLRRKYGIEVPDAIVAASAIVTGSTLITRNIKDFEIIKELDMKKPY